MTAKKVLALVIVPKSDAYQLYQAAAIAAEIIMSLQVPVVWAEAPVAVQFSRFAAHDGMCGFALDIGLGMPEISPKAGFWYGKRSLRGLVTGSSEKL